MQIETIASMYGNSIIPSIFLIFCGAAVLSTVALYTRQSLLVAYILLGVLLGPWGLKLVSDSNIVKQIGDVGIIFLMFLLGLNLQPQNLLHTIKKTTWVAFISSIVFMTIGFVISQIFNYTKIESLMIGSALMFSSTIIGLKLLPTTVLHHQHTGEMMISILLMQDLIAIFQLLFINAAGGDGLSWFDLGILVFSLPTIMIFAFLFERYVLTRLFSRFDRIREYMFLLAIAWCLGIAELAHVLGLSHEIGAFIAGISIAAGPISLYIAESLKPIRDFFLVMFFFSVGANFNWHYFDDVALAAFVMAILLLFIKPWVFRVLLHLMKETRHVAWEVGVRLGQASEFSLLIAYLASSGGLISESASYLIQATTILTFIASSYIVVLKYPTPMAISERLRRD